MAERPFEFDLFRLVVVEPDIFEVLGSQVAEDKDILQIVSEGCAVRFDVLIL